jgi:hypothetical protein
MMQGVGENGLDRVAAERRQLQMDLLGAVALLVELDQVL